MGVRSKEIFLKGPLYCGPDCWRDSLCFVLLGFGGMSVSIKKLALQIGASIEIKTCASNRRKHIKIMPARPAGYPHSCCGQASGPGSPRRSFTHHRPFLPQRLYIYIYIYINWTRLVPWGPLGCLRDAHDIKLGVPFLSPPTIHY
jgi:hypothetical protein